MKRKAFTVIALTLCVLMTALCLTACGGKGNSDGKSALLGTWSANEAEGAFYVFNEDGKGVWNAGGGAEMNFTYVEDNGAVEIIYEGTESGMTWEYSVEGDTLTMKETDSGTVLTYTKK